MTAESPPAPACYRHPGRETYIVCNRCERPICPECMVPASVGFQCVECVREGARGARQPRTFASGRVTSGAPITMTLIGANVLMFLASGVSLGGQIGRQFYDLALIPGPAFSPFGGLVGVSQGEYYRLVTSAFLHFGLLHLAFNMYALYIVGPTLERSLGRWRYGALYAFSGLGGAVATYLFAAPESVSAGASGAVFGLFAAYFVLARRIGADTGPIAATIVINLVLTFSISNISKTGHLGGLALGAVTAAIFAFVPRGPRRAMIQLGGCGALATLLVVATALGPTG